MPKVRNILPKKEHEPGRAMRPFTHGMEEFFLVLFWQAGGFLRIPDLLPQGKCFLKARNPFIEYVKLVLI